MALTKYNYNSFDVTPVASKAMGFNSSADGLTSISPSSMVLIKTLTADSDSTLDFVDGTSDVVLDNTYPIYLFTFNNMHPATDGAEFQFQANESGGSGYNETITSSHFDAYHGEDGTGATLSYMTGFDQAQGTSFETISRDVGNDNDQATSGFLHLFNPSSTTYVKHYFSDFSNVINNDQAVHSLSAGYFNTTAAIDEIQFKYSSGNIDSGTIKLYGIKDS